MNVQQLKTTLESKLGETFSESQVITYFNECLQEDLAGVLRLETVAELPITAEVTLPLNLMKLVYVEANGAELDELALNDYESDGYKVFANVLKPQNVEGTITLYYHRYPAEVTTITDTPDIPSQFKHALYYYALARYQQDDEDKVS